MHWTGFKAVAARLLLAGLLLVSVPTAAREAVHEATVPVADRSEPARQQAVRQALAEVLARLSGDPALPQQYAVTPLLADAGRYLQQYQYEGSEAAGNLLLRAGFDAATLEAQLRRQGLVLWGRERPPLLVWLAVDDGQRRRLLGAEDADPVLAELQAAARREALSLILPLFDLEDQSRVSFAGVWAGDLESVQLASQRYRASAVLVGALQQSADGWSARWALRHAGRDNAWQSRTPGLAGTLEQAMAQAAGRLVVRAASVPQPQGQTRLRLQVDGVPSLDDYARVSAHLRGLAPIRSAELVAVEGRRLEFLVEVQGGAQGLDQALSLGGMLMAERIEGGPEAVSVYRLRQ